LTYQNNLLCNALFDITFISVTNSKDGSIKAHSIVTSHDGSILAATHDVVTWNSSTSWYRAGQVYFVSQWDLPSILAFNTTGIFSYTDGTYHFFLLEKDVKGLSKQSQIIQTYGDGVYGGSWKSWHVALNKGYLYCNNSLVGTTAGSIVGHTPKHWINVAIDYALSANNSNSEVVLATMGKMLWNTNSTWNQNGFVEIVSEGTLKDTSTISWNASATGLYSGNAYLVNIQEKAVATDNLNMATQKFKPTSFKTMIEGGYGSKSYREG
jgi:hypothetical protein